ncbi:MAG: PilZ domain-containing protein [Myxococcales bacterium]|nr:PilZ domain-containing protein [Myxococcales bacterium]
MQSDAPDRSKPGAGENARLKRFLRKPVEIRVEVERYQEGLSSTSINMSPSGICFELPEPLEDGERFRVLLYIPQGKEVEILKVSARMVWQELRDDGRFRVGAAFEQFAPGDERRIRQWLLDVDKNPPPPPTMPGR